MSKLRVFGLIAFLALGSQALAAESAPSTQMAFDIPAQQLRDALNDFGRQAGLSIAFYDDAVKSHRARALTGSFTPEAALVLLLRDSNLRYEFVNERTVAIRAEDAVLRDDSPAHSGAVDRAGAIDGLRLALNEQKGGPVAAGSAAPTYGEQEQASSAEEGEADKKSDATELTVTGSRLRNVSSGSNVQILTREDINRKGLGSVEDIMRYLPQNFSNVSSQPEALSGLSENSGVNAANLRGLGTGATLILVNGRRRAQSPAFRGDGTVNLNGIPFSAIERVEVLLDGASAVYGADAQGGAINFILRKAYSGSETTARYEQGSNGGDQYRIGQTLGTGWDSGNALINVSFTSADPVKARDAGLKNVDFTSQGGTNHGSTTWGQPGVVRSAGGALLGTLPKGDDGTGGLANLSLTNFTPFDPVMANDQLEITSVPETLAGSIRFDQELVEGFGVFGEVIYSKSKVRYIGDVTRTRATVPASNPYNDLGVPVNVAYYFSAELNAGLIPQPRFMNDSKSLSYTLGVDGELPFAGWTAELSATRSEDENTIGILTVDQGLLAERLSGFDANNNPIPMNQVLNLFGNGSAQSPAALDGLFVGGGIFDGTGFGHTNTSEQNDYLLTAQGKIFELPAGEVKLLLGAEYRTETVVSFAPTVVADPERENTSYFTELGVPLVGARNGFSGAYRLDLKVALRNDQYDFKGPFDQPNVTSSRSLSKTVPKIDLAWYPVKELKLRASWGESFRAPGFSDMFGVGFGPIGVVPLVDPENPGAGVQFPALFIGGNPDLAPELSDNRSVGFDWTPGGALTGLSLSTTWSKIDITDRITNLLVIAFTAPDVLFSIPGAIVRDPVAGTLDRVNALMTNVDQRRSEAIDLDATYDFDTDFGSFQLGLGGTYISELQDVLVSSAEPITLVETSAGPDRLRARGLVGWSRDNMSANLLVNYSSSYDQLETGLPDRRIGHYVTSDLTGSYALYGSGWKFNGGIRNLFDRKFPFFNGGRAPWDPTRVNVRGRIIYLEATKSFDFL